ncbi:MAG: hypothetical protein PHY72_03470 [Candidatus Pacebacteria bacterium]|nr:hypothetical protein [Candidatus Paceibacterota bacterium]
MIEENKVKQAQEVVLEFFDKMTLPVVIEEKSVNDQILKIEIHSQEAQALIGYQGKNLADIQSVLAKIIRKKLGEDIFLDVDVNGYKNEKEQRFCDLAQDAADEAVSTKREKILFPMNSFERRIIHNELSKRSDVKTESIGEGDNRKVVIFPV